MREEPFSPMDIFSGTPCTVPSNERQPKMFLPFSHLIEEKIASFLTYLKSWWNLVLVFGKKHAIWSNITGDMIGWSWKIKLEKSNIFLFTPILSFPNLIFWLHPFITPLILDQLTWSLPKIVTTFHGEQDGIIHFCLSPNKRGVLAIWMKLSNLVRKSPLISFW